MTNDLRGSVDGWGFKQYVLGILLYRYISGKLAEYLNKQERTTGDGEPDFDYAQLSYGEVELGRRTTVEEKGFSILPSDLFVNVRKWARKGQNLNEPWPRSCAISKARPRVTSRRMTSKASSTT